jgi:dihydrofolate reductase
MRELTADMFVSLDGFAAGSDDTQGVILGHGGPELGAFIQSVLDEPQVMVLGRVSYEILSGFWPSSSEPPAARMNSLPKVVFSNSLEEPLGWNARLVKGDLAEQIRALKREAGDPLRSIGSISLVAGMVKLGLVDRLRLVVSPVVLGTAGRQPMFGGYDLTRLQLADTAVLDAKLVVLEYRPVRS